MSRWLRDTIEQIALGEQLAKSSVGCGARFGLIAVDNAVEYMVSCFVESDQRLVGNKPGQIKKKEWENLGFPGRLNYAAGHRPPLRGLEADVLTFHETRNHLYHSAIPLTISPREVLDYSKMARDLLDLLFHQQFNQTEWDDMLGKVAGELTGRTADLASRKSVRFEVIHGVIKFETSGTPSLKDAVALVLRGYATLTGTEPGRDAFQKSLRLSGLSFEPRVLGQRLYEMRQAKLVRDDKLILTPAGLKSIEKRFIV